ncbi:adhesion G-protein coupled receptor V1-like [Acipenser oxyrinchus oxyrinchus]|uniref:Adhesion G-protein coupled receptor V1 n=1 Tax=Acipenser oxyrinchus oxyrinchus TaxID=40147 RepID=A0AAD8LW42_ACIOX|nr:adhesion G-protein coupled receptor V1-like [Acipenser oxyrinchus oxyrinchus]
MPPALILAELLIALCISQAFGNTELRFLGQTEFVVNESSTTVVRLIIERTGDPVNITALILLQGDETSDFEASSAAAFLLASETNRTIYIAVKDDELPEADETFVFRLKLQSALPGVRLGSPNTATVTILSNDNAFGIISFNMSSLITVNEPRGSSQFVPLSLIREKGTYGTVTVNFEITGDPNPAEEDLSPAKGNITLPPGRATVVYRLLIRDDQIPENDEIFTIALTSVEGGAVINLNRSSVQIRINKNDSPVRFTQSVFVVPETAGVITIPVTRGRNEQDSVIGSDSEEVSISYMIVTGNSTASALLTSDFVDLQPNRTVVFPPRVSEVQLKFMIIDDATPEIAESFQVVLLEDTLQGDAVLLSPGIAQVTIEPNDKPYGVLSISSALLAQAVVIDEDLTSRFEGISIVRNGGTHGSVSVNWTITRNSSDQSSVATDLTPASGTLRFAEGQMSASLRLNITSDDLPEEAEAYLFRLVPRTVQGGVEVDAPMEMVFYIQDSDDVYGLVRFHPSDEQKIQSHPSGRFLSLSFLRQRGTVGDVRLNYTTLYISTGPIDPGRAKDGVLNTTRTNSVLFPAEQSQVQVTLPIRNDAFLQNGAHFLVQLDSVELVSIPPPIPPVSPRLWGVLNISLIITPDIANGEIGFTSNQTLVVFEPETASANLVSLALQRDGTDGQAVVFWSLRPSGLSQREVTLDDLGPFNGSVTFLSGQSDSSINITIRADDISEVNETLSISLDRTNAENQILKSGFTSREIVIFENDDPGGVFEFSLRSRGPWLINEGEAVELRVVRSQGALLKQLLRYEVMPSSTYEFYGSTGILEFKPGEREVVVALVARPDGTPELDEVYSVVLSSHSAPPSKLGAARHVDITIRKNDDPHGVIEFSRAGLLETLNESKGSEIHSASYTVVRNRGTFGDVSVSWSLDTPFSEDVHPVHGTLSFTQDEFSKNITLTALPDEVPEDMEGFTITLLNVTGGARLGNALNATLQIRKNDDPIYFADPVAIRVQEGDVVSFTVLRNGSSDFVATVMYQTASGGTSEDDFIPDEGDHVLVFEIGERMKNISVTIVDDDIPETEEPFYILLFNATGDSVVYGADTATVVIEANDDANGIFSLEPVGKAVEEGSSNDFMVVRDRGMFGTVTIFWQLFGNGSVLDTGQEFYNTSGTIVFENRERSKPITLHALSDKIPEFNEVYVLMLTNISGGYPGPGGRLAEANQNVMVLIPFNDDPFGVFVIDPESLDQEVAEDILSEDDMSDITSFTILRNQGTFGVVRVGWEILSDAFRSGLPPMRDLILQGSFPGLVELRPHLRRHHSGTDALFFSGSAGAFGTVSPEDQLVVNQSLASFTFSAWLMASANTNGFIIAKANENGTLYYGMKIQTNESHVVLLLYYTPVGSNATQVAKATAMRFLEDNVWLHVIITLDDGIIEFYMDGSPIAGGTTSLKGEAIADGRAAVRIGAGADGSDRYTGLMQDVRLYSSRLSRAEIHELHSQPAKADLRNVSGYLEYREGESRKAFIVEVRDDREEEAEEFFSLWLVSVHGGARLLQENTPARLRIQKSDNANGLFGFTGACIPDASEEGSVTSCVVERTRGALDYVYVNYTVTQTDSSSDSPTAPDFANSSGTITFLPWQRSEVLNLQVLDDDIPEFAEHFRVTLVSAVSGDGKQGSTPTSGASIDPENMSTNIIIKASDHPNGLLQFSKGPPPDPAGEMIRPALAAASITVEEEVGEIRLLVVRAQGLLGRVLVGYRTVPLTAVSPYDYEETDGTLEFQPEERFQYIHVNITDDSVPELDKSFRVELYNPAWGVGELFRSEGSASGDGDADLFLPTFHQRASLGMASHITVTIAASDDAHGVFQFSNDSLAVSGTEPEGGHGTVVLQVDRTGGALSRVTLFWEVDSDLESDLINKIGNVTFEVSQTRADIVVQVSSDEVPELDKTFVVRIGNVSHGRLGALTNASLTVLANDDPYGLFVFSEKNRPIQVMEANTNVTLVIQRLKGLMGSVQLSYRTVRADEGSPTIPSGIARANEGSDYLAIVGSVIFAANQSEANITLRVLDDLEPEQAESVFVQLINVTVLQGVQDRTIYLSPRLGPVNETVAQVIIGASDDAFGVLQLSSPSVSVAENYVGPIVNVTRTGGIFADVSVKFRAVPMTARVGEDYSVASSDVVLLEGETSKSVPIYIINDVNPEIEERFRIELLNQTTGGALLGGLTQCIITIEASDDPYGSFIFQVATLKVEEPNLNATKVNLPIVRNAGTLGNVTVGWAATVNGQPASDDLRPASGQITFAPGETMKTLTVEVLADDVAETEEIIRVELMTASNGGSIGAERFANIIVPPNDNPYGTVSFRQTVYRVHEPLEGAFIANITVMRSGGRFGRLQILYSTAEIDVVDKALKEGQDVLAYYDLPVPAVPVGPFRMQVNVTSQKEPLLACATFCLRERACQAFSFSNTSGVARCDWMASLSNKVTNSSEALTYRKNSTTLSSLLNVQAIAGSDYESVTGNLAIMLEGEETANLTVPILSDSLPEVDETFTVHLLRVDLVNITATTQNRPSIGLTDTARVTISMNGDAFGVFLIYSTSPNATKGGLYLEVQEELQNMVLLVIERRGGSLGQVTVEWSVVGGTATLNTDFNGTGEVLTFADGDLRKTIQLSIVDDSEPEGNETIVVSLTQTEGGSRILPSSDTVTILILASDNAAGVIGFQTSSRSVMAREGESVQLLITRSAPGLGNVTVDWSIQGPRVEQNFANFTGVLFFPQGSLNASISVKLLDDGIPEEKEEYRVILANIRTEGVHPMGAAALDRRGFEAVLTVEASDEPYGVLSFAPLSKMVSTREGNESIQLFIRREFGSLGSINISYETVHGSLQTQNQTEGSLAEPGQDFIPAAGFLVLQEGQTSAAINITILEDELPELQEFFLVNITSAVLVTRNLASPFDKLDIQGLVAQITIDASDGVRGIIAWQSIKYEVNESIGSLTLVAYRNGGTYGNVSLFFYAQNLEAQLGLDYNATSTILHFADGERHQFIEVLISDDDIPEGDEKFQLVLANPSFGLELGNNTTATVTILANDDGHGVISFNNSEHFFLKEPTSLGLSESVAMLFVVRDPPQGTFGVVTVQYLITSLNGSDASQDLQPSQGFVVLEDGVRFKTLQISAVLDEEPEMNETFMVTLSDPTGGARLGSVLQTLITVLQNQAPLGLFRIFPVNSRASSVTVEEGNRTVYLRVSRSNGLDTEVSVEWETQSDTAYGMRGDYPALPVLQSFPEQQSSGWCTLTSGGALYALRLGIPPASPSLEEVSTLYRWQGVFVPGQSLKIQGPRSCISFAMNGSSYIAITHGGQDDRRASNTSLFRLAPDMNLTLVQSWNIAENSDVKHFVLESTDYLITASQVFRWNGNMFTFHQDLSIPGASGLSLFLRGNSWYLAVSVLSPSQSCVLYQWAGDQFRNPQALPLNTPAKQVQAFHQGAEVYLLLLTEEYNSTCEVFVWRAGQSFFQHFQSISHGKLNTAQAFTPPSGIIHLLLAGKNTSGLYSWRSELNRFSLVLEVPPAQQLFPVSAPHLNATKTLIAAAGGSGSRIYELISVSNQSDFIPSSGELRFKPGDGELEIAVNVIDDNIPEEEESFRVRLKNPKGGAEISVNGHVTVVIPSNDDAHGIVAFAQSSLSIQAEELEQDNLLTLSIERLRGTFGRITVHWEANGSLSDVFPTFGEVTFAESQAFAPLALTVLADSIPELAETVIVTLTEVTTVGIRDPTRGAVVDPLRNRAKITILPNDSPYGVIGWHSDSLFVTTQEPDVKQINVTLKIVREQGFVGDVAVRYKTKPAFSQLPVNQATEHEDYVAQEATVIMKENVPVVYVQVAVLPDNIPELAESFLVNITGVELLTGSLGGGQPSVKRLGMETAEVTIEENDEPRGILQFNLSKAITSGVTGYEVLPPQNVLQLLVIRLAGRFGAVGLDWKAQPISANLEDFSPAFGNLTFSDGQGSGVIEITIIDDSIVEFLESFSVSLTRVTGGARLGNDTTVIVNIPPNDSPVGLFSFEQKTVTVREPQFTDDPAGQVTLAVVRSLGGRGAVQIIWLVEEAARDDLSPLNGTLQFNETESKKTIVLRAYRDAVLEGDERFIIQLLSATNDAAISPIDGTATVVILGDQGALGRVGIATLSQNVLIGEPMGNYNGTALISLVRGPGIFGEITVYWNITPPIATEFEETSGMLIMRDRQSAATIQLKALDDNVPEERQLYQLTLTGVSEGAELDQSMLSVNITMAASDSPFGRFSFSQEFLQASEEDRQVKITVVRGGGSFARVQLWYQTLSSSAVGGSDFTPVTGQLVFGPGEANRPISVEILNDELPEGPEEFFINITRVEILGGSGLDFTVRENGLQLDQPPAVGNISSIRIAIEKSDNAEGVIEFDPQYLTLHVEEDAGTVVIPVLRRQGTFGLVTADFISRSVTALANGVDYRLPNSSVTFHHGQNQSFINISIIDDMEREYEEHFEIQLTAATGGAVLGTHLVTRVTIAKSDSPNGLIRFLNESLLVIPNSNITQIIMLALDRTGGLVGAAEIKWNILGPNSKEVLPSVNTDIGEPVNGSFHFRDGEGGIRTIDLKIFPHGDVEVQETFIIKLSLLSGEVDIDPRAGNVTLVIQKFGDPNGIVQFTQQSLRQMTYMEPSSAEGTLSITFLVTRVQGTMGIIMVFWELHSDSDVTGDFGSVRGSVAIPDMQRSVEITIHLLPDDVPELDEECTLLLSSVEGGAELDLNKSSTRFTVKANDDPHGLFAVYSDRQSVNVGPELSRHILLNITRHAGAFGNVSVEYKITADGQGQDFFMDTVLGNLLVKDGSSFGTSVVPISNRVFFATGFNFTIQLSNVSLVGGSFSNLPHIQMEAKTAVVSVPEEAANSEVGFDSVALQVSDSTASSCAAVISRVGLYGNVWVEWSSGYPPGQEPAGLQLGHITPTSGTVTFAHGERSRSVPLSVVSNVTGAEVFAVFLRAVHSNSSGGARLRSGFTTAEIEPLGIFQFAPNSRQLVIEEDVQTVTLSVQRLFGFHSNRTSLTYLTSAGSAKPVEDFEAVQNGELIFESRQTEAFIRLSVLNDNIMEADETFYVNLTNVEVLNGRPTSPYLKPRLIPESSVASVTILANDIINGLLSIGPTLVHAVEDTNNSTLRGVMLRVRRTVGFTGVIRAMVKTFGGKSLTSGLQGTPFEGNRTDLNHTWAREGEDFEEQTVMITLLEGEREADVSIGILDDEEPEGQEVFFVYLTSPQGGAHIVEGKDENGFTSFTKIIILGSDFQNGIVGFSVESLAGLVLDEDSENRKVVLTVQRQENRVFEDVAVSWRVTFNKTSVLLQNNGVNLTSELLSIAGTTTCHKGETLCFFSLEIRPDKVPEFGSWFLVELYQVGAGAMINDSSRFANITVVESDSLQGLLLFAVGSRLPVVHQKSTLLSLQVVRESSTSSLISVSYSMQELKKAETVGHTTIWPAVAGMDFVKSEGILTFEAGQRSVLMDITLTPDQASSNPLPKRFQVVLYNPTGGARVDPELSVANVTIVSDPETQAVWALVEQLYQPLDDSILNRVLQSLLSKIMTEVTGEQLSAVINVLEKVIAEGAQTPLGDTSRSLTYDILCAMANPSRKDTRGLSQLLETAERFSFSLLTGTQCGSQAERGKTILDSCPYIAIKAYHWYPQQINGHEFNGKNGDSLRVPEALLEVLSLVPGDMSIASCEKVQFTEYSSQQWFLTSSKPTALNNKIFSVSLEGRGSRPLADNSEVTYRIYAAERRIKPRQSLCLLWNQAAESWLSDSQFCRVVDDTANFVECACSHLSIYTAYAQTDNLSSYNEAFHTAGFICISGFSLAILSHLFCSRFSMFAAKLLMHMMVACLGTQISFLVSAYSSRQLSVESCSALGLLAHYLHLSQFSWMLIQAVNFWHVLVMNDEHTERRYLLFFALSWGLPAFVIALLVIILRGAYHWSMPEIYGPVYGDVCFIPNVYAALSTAALIPLTCLVGVFVVFIHAYQVTPQWKAYDDVFRGRTNGTEVPLVMYLFALISLVWLWGGLHMAYRHLWMLIMYVIFNSMLGLYVFMVYFILHNQLCWPVKASYSVEMSGHPSPGSAFQGTGGPSVGGEISKSTQNLITAMEEVPPDWERTSLRPNSQASSVLKQSPQNGKAYTTQGGFPNSSLVAEEESQEFDDLIFALKTGSCLNMNDNESGHGSQDGGSRANSQIVELRRIPIADTHL